MDPAATALPALAALADVASGPADRVARVGPADRVAASEAAAVADSERAVASAGAVASAAARGAVADAAVAAGPVTVYDPITRAPVPGNRIPASQLNPAALGLLQYIPLPNQPGSVQNYQILNSIPANSDQFGFILNRTLTRKDRLNGNFQI